jgi:uncharacterized protein (DUF2141 family)
MIIKKIIFIMGFVMVNTVVFAQQNTLTVNITGINSTKGNVYVYLYTSEEGFPIEISKANNIKKAEVFSNNVTVIFKNLKPGIYAVSVYQDIDANGKINKNFLGIPKEPVGVSNNAKGFMGPPKYEDAKFNLNSNKTIEIKLNKE